MMQSLPHTSVSVLQGRGKCDGAGSLVDSRDCLFLGLQGVVR